MICDRYGQYVNPSVTVQYKPWSIHSSSQGLTIATLSYLASPQYRPNEFREFWMQQLVSYFKFQSLLQYQCWSETICTGSQQCNESSSRSCSWLQTVYIREHLCIFGNSACWFRRYRGVDNCDLPTNSVWWSIAVDYHRCRGGDSLWQDRWHGMICLWLCVSPLPETETVTGHWSRHICSIWQ